MRARIRFLLLVFQAYSKLVYFDRYLALGSFIKLYHKVQTCAVRSSKPDYDALSMTCSAVDFACIWYWKQVACLQRSAATTCLLRDQGVLAALTFGTQQIPFKAHAWVEVAGRVVNDKSYMREMYVVLDRC